MFSTNVNYYSSISASLPWLPKNIELILRFYCILYWSSHFSLQPSAEFKHSVSDGQKQRFRSRIQSESQRDQISVKCVIFILGFFFHPSSLNVNSYYSHAVKITVVISPSQKIQQQLNCSEPANWCWNFNINFGSSEHHKNSSTFMVCFFLF